MLPPSSQPHRPVPPVAPVAMLFPQWALQGPSLLLSLHACVTLNISPRQLWWGSWSWPETPQRTHEAVPGRAGCRVLTFPLRAAAGAGFRTPCTSLGRRECGTSPARVPAPR